MHRAPDSVDADPSDVRRHERTIDDESVTVTVVTATGNEQIIVKADQRWELVIDDGWAYPRWDNRSWPDWLEGLVTDFGVRGVRTGTRDGQ